MRNEETFKTYFISFLQPGHRFFCLSTLSFPPTMMHGNRVAPLTNATNATANANFDALPSYESYDLAWLG